jgi:hypothetical protein
MATRVAPTTTAQLTEIATGRHVVRRGIAAVGLLGIALIDVLDLEGKLDELPYVGALFIWLIIVCLVLAEALIRSDHPFIWWAAGIVAGATIVGYSISRPRGCPVITATMSATG